MNHPKGMCEECNKRIAHYGIYRTRDEKEWVKVCDKCEKTIGDENMRRWLANSLLEGVNEKVSNNIR